MTENNELRGWGKPEGWTPPDIKGILERATKAAELRAAKGVTK